ESASSRRSLTRRGRVSTALKPVFPRVTGETPTDATTAGIVAGSESRRRPARFSCRSVCCRAGYKLAPAMPEPDPFPRVWHRFERCYTVKRSLVWTLLSNLPASFVKHPDTRIGGNPRQWPLRDRDCLKASALFAVRRPLP